MRKEKKITVRDLIESELVDDRTDISLETENEVFEGKQFDDFIMDNLARQLVKVVIDPMNNKVVAALKEI